MAMPAVTTMPLAASALALPVPLMTPVLVMVLALLEVRRSGLTAALGRPAPRPAGQPGAGVTVAPPSTGVEGSGLHHSS
jgi:hypothetical protein